MIWLLLACRAAPEDSAAPVVPVLGELVQVVPSEGLPDEVVVQDAANNLDVTWNEGEAFLAFRTAPSHFASADAEMFVLRSADQVHWTLEFRYSMATDLREPRLLSWQGTLYLYFAVLGDSPTAFEPQGTMLTMRAPDGTWSTPTWWDQEGFMPWRIHILDGAPELTGYTGGDEVYDLPEDSLPQIKVKWFRSQDGEQWAPFVDDHPIVWTGGASETDLAFTEDGAVIAVLRNEAGDAEGFGSLICRGEPGSLADWTCARDLKRYDSPLVFSHGGRIWLMGRRNLTETGAYDLQMTDLSYTQQYLQYQIAYWNAPKRCALWEIDPTTLAVEWVLDLPSRGDTCFVSVLPEADGSYSVYNYSSDPEGPDLSWLDGQNGVTRIYRQQLWLPD